MVDSAVLAGTRIAVVDDHRLLAQMMVDHLNRRGGVAVTADVADIGLVTTLQRLDAEVILLDAVFHDDEDGGLRVLQEMSDSDAEIVMLTGVTDTLRHAEFLAAGAVAVISKADSFDGVLRQVEDVISGLDPMGATRRAELARQLAVHRRRLADDDHDPLRSLTSRELATLQNLVDGKTVDEIASMRTVASSTVRSQVRSVLQKLDSHSQIEAVSIGARQGMRPSGD